MPTCRRRSTKPVNTMIGAERHDAIVRELRLRGTLRIKEFSDRLSVSAVTLRRDLRELEDAGQLVRVHGGARFLRRRSSDKPLAQERLSSSFGLTRRGDDEPPIGTIGMIVPMNAYYYAKAIEGPHTRSPAANGSGSISRGLWSLSRGW